MSHFDLIRQFEASSPKHVFYRHVTESIDPYRAMFKQTLDLPSFEENISKINELEVSFAQLILTGAIRAFSVKRFR